MFWLCWIFIATYRLSIVAVSGGPSLVTVHRLLIVVASLVVEHSLWCSGFSSGAAHA